MEKACERRLYSTNFTFNLNNNSLLLITTTVDPLSTFCLNSKRRLRSCYKLRSKGIPCVRLVNAVTLLHISRQRAFIENIFLVSILFKKWIKQHPSRTRSKIWKMTSLWLKLRVFCLHEIWVLKRNNMKPYAGGTQTSQNTRISLALQGDIIWHLHRCNLKDYFLKLATWKIWKSAITCFQKPAKSFISCEIQNNLFLAW